MMICMQQCVVVCNSSIEQMVEPCTVGLNVSMMSEVLQHSGSLESMECELNQVVRIMVRDEMVGMDRVLPYLA